MNFLRASSFWIHGWLTMENPALHWRRNAKLKWKYCEFEFDSSGVDALDISLSSPLRGNPGFCVVSAPRFGPFVTLTHKAYS